MAKPPPSGPHSDIDGVNRDARVNTPSRQPQPDPGAAIADAKKANKARPEGGTDAGKEEG